MESPSLSRTASANFAPGPHRRSHPNLHHLSLAPLTPKYPIDPSDYEAYFDPATSELHTSNSLSQIASVPSPGGILTSSPVRSRASSRMRKKLKSTVSIQEPPHGALTSEGFGYKRSDITPRPQKVRSSLKLNTDPSWLIQTGLTLTEGSRESKGQSWITKRDSSTSMNTPAEEYRSRSGRATPRIRSARQSKRNLAMTPATDSYPVDEDVVPDWADSRSQAEIAAQIQEDLANEFDFDETDPYGVLDFDGHFESSEDEEEVVRQAISNYKLGQWMDGMVDAMLQIEEKNKPPEEDTEESENEISNTDRPPLSPSGPAKGEMSWWMRFMSNAFTRV